MAFDFSSCLAKGQQHRDEGASNEDLLRLFRQEEASMMDSVKLIRQLNAVSLKRAQEIVHFSETWADQRESQEHLQDLLAEALKKLGQPEK